MSTLSIKSLSAGYGKARVLRDVDLDVEESEALAIIGRNGAGKSTLLMSMFGGATIHEGTVTMDGVTLNPRRAFHAAQLGLAVAPQGKQIFSNLTIKENLLLGAASRRGGYWNLKTIYELFPVLRERASRPGTALSGGQQQMLSIARALMANPRIVMLDEPTEGLAPVFIDQIVTALHEIRARGTGLIIVEQHLNLVRRVADRFLILAKGEVAASGSIDDIDSPGVRAELAL